MNTIKSFDIFAVVEGKTKVFTIQAETEQQAKDQVNYPITKVIDLGDVGEWNDDVSITEEEIDAFVTQGMKILDEMEKEFYPTKETNMFAHYFIGKGQKFVVISATMQPVGTKIHVTGKAEAKKIAKEHNAKPWNF